MESREFFYALLHSKARRPAHDAFQKAGRVHPAALGIVQMHRADLVPLANQAADSQNSAIMRSSTLCRERLNRIQSILARNAGALTVREFARTYSVLEWEIEQAAALGWIKIETHRPRTGRPSRIAKIVSETQAAKHPPYRWQIDQPISFRHLLFAMHSTCAVKRGSRKLVYLPAITDVYQSVFKRATKRRGATASASRLMRRSDVKAARAWYYARFDGDAPRSESMPETEKGIWQRLRELGSWRAGPRITVIREA